MSIQLTGSVNCKISAVQLNSLDLGVSYSGTPLTEFSKIFTSSDITKLYFKTRTVTAASETLDLSNASLTDPFGNTLTFTNLKAVYIKNKHATSPLTVFGGTTPTIANTLVITAGGSVCLTSTFTVDSTHKLIKVDPGAATINYDIFLLGS